MEIEKIEVHRPVLPNTYFPSVPTVILICSKKSIPKVPTSWNDKSKVNIVRPFGSWDGTFCDLVSHPQTQSRCEVEETLP